MSKTTNKFPRQCASAPCNWCLITNMNILSADRRSAIGDHVDVVQDRHEPDAERVGEEGRC